MKFKVVISQDEDEDEKFVARCPALSGCISEGTKREEIVANVKDAIESYLASLKNEPIPPSIEDETDPSAG